MPPHDPDPQPAGPIDAGHVLGFLAAGDAGRHIWGTAAAGAAAASAEAGRPARLSDLRGVDTLLRPGKSLYGLLSRAAGGAPLVFDQATGRLSYPFPSPVAGTLLLRPGDLVPLASSREPGPGSLRDGRPHARPNLDGAFLSVASAVAQVAGLGAGPFAPDRDLALLLWLNVWLADSAPVQTATRGSQETGHRRTRSGSVADAGPTSSEPDANVAEILASLPVFAVSADPAGDEHFRGPAFEFLRGYLAHLLQAGNTQAIVPSLLLALLAVSAQLLGQHSLPAVERLIESGVPGAEILVVALESSLPRRADWPALLSGAWTSSLLLGLALRDEGLWPRCLDSTGTQLGRHLAQRVALFVELGPHGEPPLEGLFQALCQAQAGAPTEAAGGVQGIALPSVQVILAAAGAALNRELLKGPADAPPDVAGLLDDPTSSPGADVGADPAQALLENALSGHVASLLQAARGEIRALLAAVLEAPTTPVSTWAADLRRETTHLGAPAGRLYDTGRLMRGLRQIIAGSPECGAALRRLEICCRGLLLGLQVLTPREEEPGSPAGAFPHFRRPLARPLVQLLAGCLVDACRELDFAHATDLESLVQLNERAGRLHAAVVLLSLGPIGAFFAPVSYSDFEQFLQQPRTGQEMRQVADWARGQLVEPYYVECLEALTAGLVRLFQSLDIPGARPRPWAERLCACGQQLLPGQAPAAGESLTGRALRARVSVHNGTAVYLEATSAWLVSVLRACSVATAPGQAGPGLSLDALMSGALFCAVLAGVACRRCVLPPGVGDSGPSLECSSQAASEAAPPLTALDHAGWAGCFPDAAQLALASLHLTPQHSEAPAALCQLLGRGAGMFLAARDPGQTLPASVLLIPSKRDSPLLSFSPLAEGPFLGLAGSAGWAAQCELLRQTARWLDDLAGAGGGDREPDPTGQARAGRRLQFTRLGSVVVRRVAPGGQPPVDFALPLASAAVLFSLAEWPFVELEDVQRGGGCLSGCTLTELSHTMRLSEADLRLRLGPLLARGLATMVGPSRVALRREPPPELSPAVGPSEVDHHLLGWLAPVLSDGVLAPATGAPAEQGGCNLARLSRAEATRDRRFWMESRLCRRLKAERQLSRSRATLVCLGLEEASAEEVAALDPPPAGGRELLRLACLRGALGAAGPASPSSSIPFADRSLVLAMGAWAEELQGRLERRPGCPSSLAFALRANRRYWSAMGSFCRASPSIPAAEALAAFELAHPNQSGSPVQAPCDLLSECQAAMASIVDLGYAAWSKDGQQLEYHI
ncbi:hypothetical protein H696_01191 [Fonticula alba]|uniref:Uncharacterized protein n=1 Tax=Fonticula alba TaxID=691883 RepID=A0A058ZCW7_FONAL|nr:hypothetical protein H696_01191 [Fonticula alba]KCV71773.1 hypothetical protein H696_01191 [Fonticula alba]|eukprot:XP_009493351.1 hypothetical protein H696_01191 [Fonticula alba]